MNDYIVREFQDRRTQQPPVPSELQAFLNQKQFSTLLFLQALGWHLWFVRHPLFQSHLVVLWNPTNKYTATLEEDGELNINHGQEFRLDQRNSTRF
jgi:hypothetical protein